MSRRVLSPHSAAEIAEAISLLATNGNITGTVLETDGGAKLSA